MSSPFGIVSFQIRPDTTIRQVRSNNASVVAFYASLGYKVEERISMGKRLPDV